MVDPAYLVGAGAALGAVLRFATGRYVGGVAGALGSRFVR